MKTNQYIKLIYQFAVISILCLFNYASKAQTITTSPTLTNEYCGGVDIVVNYTITGTFGGTNVFTAQLSDEFGSFSSPVPIGQLTSVTDGTILATIPANTGLGLGYRIRVVGSSPSIIGSNNGTDLKINLKPTAVAGVVNDSICSNDVVNLAGVLGPAAPVGTWTTSGTGTFSNPNNLVGTYTPSASDIDSIVLTLTSNDPAGSCLAASDQITIRIFKVPSVNAGIDQNTCILTNSINLSGSFGGSASSINWISLGTGSFNNSTLLNAIYTPSALDKSAGFVKLVISTNVQIGPCAAAKDTMLLTFNPVVMLNAGIDETICSNGSIVLNATTAATSGTLNWTTSGTGVFTNGNTLTPIYFPSITDKISGSVKLTITNFDPINPCQNNIDSMILTINQLAVTNAGVDQTVCASSNNVSLIGTVSGSVSTGSWSTLGTGTFTNASSLITNYILSATDKAAGTVQLVLTSSDPIGPCNSVSDTMIITINPIATADAGPDQVICGNSSAIVVGSVGGSATSGSWTSITNSPFISFTALTEYFPTPTEKANGFVVLTYTTNDPIGPCAATKDSLVVALLTPAISNAGADQTVCASNNNVSLIGNVSGTVTTGSWITLGTGTFSNATSLVTNYTLSAIDKAAGLVKLILTSSDPVGPCSSVSDTMIVIINPQATVDAGPDQIICGNSSVNIIGTVGGSATSGSWTSSTNNPFISFTANTNYFPTPTEVLNGFVVLTYTTNDPIGPCSAVKDSLIVTLVSPPFSDAGFDQTVCSNISFVNLAGNFGNGANFANWSTLGSGTFNNIIGNTANYIPSPLDKLNGFVEILYTTDNPAGPCNQAVDTVIITFRPTATIFAGIDQTICINNNIILNASTTASSGTLTWTTSGSGIFINGNSLTPTYVPSLADNILGSVTLTISNFDPGNICQTVNDSMLLTINQLAIADAGLDQTVCSSNDTVSLIGNISGAVTKGSWRTLGSGLFTNSSSLVTSYILSPNDKAAGLVKLILTSKDPIGPCNSAIDTMTITFIPTATIYAGIDQTICRNNSIFINASTTATSGTITWTTNGTGTFSNVNALKPTYIPSLADNILGSVKLTITNFDPTNTCQNVVDAMILTINQLAVADAGLDQTVCVSIDSVSLAGIVSGSVSTGSWRTLGTGSFTSATSLVTNYKFSATDKAVGSVELILTSSNPVGPCNSVSDTLIITINPLATVNAGLDQTICGNSPATVTGIVGGSASSGSWTSSTNSTYISLTAITNYFPTPTEIANGSLVLTYTSNDPLGPCSATADSLVVTINPAAIVNAGADQIICASSDTISLVGTISGSPTNVSWNTLGTGTFTSDTALITKYILSATDKLAGVVSLILKDGQCFAVRDTVVITINQIPTINAGLDQVICGNNVVNLVGLIGGSTTTGTWTSSTNSLFSSTDSIVDYFPTDSQIANGSFFITYTSNDPSGLCGIASDSMEVTVNVPPVVNAGKDIYTCSYASSVDIIGTKSGFPTNSLWVTLNGSGSFIDSSSLSTKYIPSAADLAAKSIIISLTTNDPIGPCYAAYDDVNVYFKDSTVTFTSVVKNIYCDSMEIEFVNDSNNVGYTFARDFGDGFYSNIANPVHTYNYTGSINVNLVASGPGGCIESVNNTFNINSVKPKADFVVNNLNQCLNDNSFEINNASQDASAGWINDVKWDFGDNTNSTATIPNNKTYSKSGNYNIKLVVSTTNGCQDSIVKGVNVLQSPEKPIVTLFDGKVLISSSLTANHWYYSNIEIPGATNKYYATSKFGVYKLRVDSTNGCSNFSDDLDLKYTSKTENVTNDKFKIYPNPTNGLFNIESQLELNYSIYDYSGKEIITGKKDGNIQLLDLSNFKSGIYLIKLYNDQEQFISKIIKD